MRILFNLNGFHSSFIIHPSSLQKMVPQEQNLQKKCKMVPREHTSFPLLCYNNGDMLNAYNRSPGRRRQGARVEPASSRWLRASCPKPARRKYSCWQRPGSALLSRGRPQGPFKLHVHSTLFFRGFKVIQGYSRLNFFRHVRRHHVSRSAGVPSSVFVRVSPYRPSCPSSPTRTPFHASRITPRRSQPPVNL